MPTLHAAQLIIIEGPDATTFAQSQFSSNVDDLVSDQWRFSAWLDAQGRVRAFFHLAKCSDDKLVLLLRGGNAEIISNELRRFLFRARVTLSTTSDATLKNGAALPLYALHVEDTKTVLGCGTHSLIISSAETRALENHDDAWRMHQMKEGWAWLPDNALNELLPPAISLHRLGAVAIDKGCYPGQEIVARMHYRNGHKRHLHRVSLSQHIEAGELLRRSDREFVRVLDVLPQRQSYEALAVISDDVANNILQSEENTSDHGIVVGVQQVWAD